MADTRDWINQGQPQTLVIACFLLYFNAFFGLLSLLGAGGIGLLIGVAEVVGNVFAGRGIAQERTWGWVLGLVMSLLPFVFSLIFLGNPFAGFGLIGLLFAVALVALLLHPQSTQYRKIWFK
jgi:uncharacterized membrane protein HdeD (DUF308 family)